MATTPGGLWYPDGSDNINPLHPVLGAMQTSVGGNPRFNTPAGIHVVSNAAGLTTLATNLTNAGYTISVSNPAYAYRADTQMIYENRGSGWAPYSNTLQFADAAARDTAIPSGNRRVGMVVAVGTGASIELYVWNGSGWVSVGVGVSTLTLSPLFVAGTPASSPTAVRGNGWVSLTGGWTMAGSPSVAYNATTVLLTLPVGYRPANSQVFPSGPYGSAAQITAGVRVEASGAVSVHVNNGGSGSTTAVFSLNGVRFRVA